MQVPAAGSIEDFINVENGLGKFEGETGLGWGRLHVIHCRRRRSRRVP